MRLGYACINLSLPTRLRTCRLANATPERVLELARHNLRESVRAARWNAEHGLGVLRLTSDMVPFASHPEVDVDWREELAQDLAAAGDAFREAGQRVSTHPGQFTVLNSPRPDVVEASHRELAYHADLLGLMGIGGDMVLHVGGVYGDREASRERFVEEALALPDPVRERLVVENDDVSWNAGEALRVSDETGIPVVFDVYHDRLLRTPDLTPKEALRRCLATWPPGRRPKIHYSDPAPGGRRGQHGDWVDPEVFARFLHAVEDLPDFDVVVEAKKKDLAALRLLPALEAARPEAAAAR